MPSSPLLPALYLLPRLALCLVPCLGCATAPPPAAASVSSAAAPPGGASAPAATVGPEWAALRPLLGSWSGTGGDAAHPSSGGFTLAPDLGGKVLVRRGTNDAPSQHHEDLTLIYPAPGPAAAAAAFQASYFDNEGHTIHYTVTPSADGHSIVFLGDDQPGAPRFRLTYDLVAADRLSITFAMAAPGTTEFRTYITGEVHRTGS